MDCSYSQTVQKLHTLEEEIANRCYLPASQFTKRIQESFPMRLILRPALRAARNHFRPRAGRMAHAGEATQTKVRGSIQVS
jgi:hypothetical protein